MGTKALQDSASSALFGKTRRAVLALLLSRPDEAFYLREIVRAVGLGQGTVQRELERLARAGIIRRFRQGRHVYFQADSECPVFAELRGIILKTAGVVEVLQSALASLSHRIRVAFVYGSVARGELKRGSDIDLCVIGDASFAQIVAAIAPPQEALGREVNPTVYSAREFQRKLAARHHFVSRLADDPKLFIFGDQRQFTGLGE